MGISETWDPIKLVKQPWSYLRGKFRGVCMEFCMMNSGEVGTDSLCKESEMSKFILKSNRLIWLYRNGRNDSYIKKLRFIHMI